VPRWPHIYGGVGDFGAADVGRSDFTAEPSLSFHCPVRNTILGQLTVDPMRLRQILLNLLSSPAVDMPLIAVMRQALNETGFVEGQNVTLDYRWAELATDAA
jgi:hypothetical protein